MKLLFSSSSSILLSMFVYFCFLFTSLFGLATPTKSTSSSSSIPTQILVTGASGRTGQIVFEKLLNDKRYNVKAAVRSEQSAKQLKKNVPKTQLDQIIICDVTKDLKNNSNDTSKLGLDGCDAMIICTSAVPRISKRSLFKNLLLVPINIIQGNKAFDFRKLRFIWKNGQYPELVDYYGQIAQIDLATKLNMKHVIIVSSMGGTDSTNFLNAVGKNPTDGTGHGDILLWKRKAEKYLINSGLDYTIIHPGGLIDTPGGNEQYVLDINDKLMKNTKRSISREDVANLCIAALSECVGKKISLDCITIPTTNNDNDIVHSPEVAIREFIKDGKIYNYDI